MSQNMTDFYRALQVNLQHYIHDALTEVEKQAEKADASLGDVSFCFGSVFASVLFELVREADALMSAEEKDLIEQMIEPFVLGFSEKLELLTNPDPEIMEVISQ